MWSGHRKRVRRHSEGHTSCAGPHEKQSESGRLLHANPTAEQRWLPFPSTAHESPSKTDGSPCITLATQHKLHFWRPEFERSRTCTNSDQLDFKFKHCLRVYSILLQYSYICLYIKAPTSIELILEICSPNRKTSRPSLSSARVLLRLWNSITTIL